jgi:xanthine dehydrogenase accessory factor
MSDRGAFHARFTLELGRRTPLAVATVVRGEPLGAKLLLLPEETLGSLGAPHLDAVVGADARGLLAAERSETRAYPSPNGEVEVFLETFPPPPTLLIVGAVHVGQALCAAAKPLGFDVVVVDARAKLATTERFRWPIGSSGPGRTKRWPSWGLASNWYVAILTHDPKFDEPAILGALATPARYIGAIGSRKTNEDRRRRLAESGLAANDLARVRAPIGLDIGAATPEEMAVSILGRDHRRSPRKDRRDAHRGVRSDPRIARRGAPGGDNRRVIAGVIIAAGASSRLGRPKQLLPLAGRPLLAHALANALASRLDAVVLVLGHEASTIERALVEALGPTRTSIVVNPRYAEGQSTSVVAGSTPHRRVPRRCSSCSATNPALPRRSSTRCSPRTDPAWPRSSPRPMEARSATRSSLPATSSPSSSA